MMDREAKVSSQSYSSVHLRDDTDLSRCQLIWHCTDIKRVRKFIGNHIEAVAYVKNPEGAGTGILLEFRTQRHELQRLVIPRTALVGDGLEALRAIVDRGYYYNLDCRKCLLGYLFRLGGDVDKLYTIADKTGWVNGSFLTPAKTYGDGNLRFRDPEPDNNMTEIQGTLDGWKREVAAKCAGNSRLLFSLGKAFASPLLPLAQIESGGFHLVGTTSIGKTTALKMLILLIWWRRAKSRGSIES